MPEQPGLCQKPQRQVFFQFGSHEIVTCESGCKCKTNVPYKEGPVSLVGSMSRLEFGSSQGLQHSFSSCQLQFV